MNKMTSILRELFKLGARKAFCTLLLLAFIVAAYIQAYAFVDDVPDVPKPLLYDLLRPFDFWAPAMLLIMPMALLSLPLQWLGLAPLSPPLVWPLQALYVYSLSSLLVFGHDHWGSKWKKEWRWLIWMLPFMVVVVLWTPGIWSGISVFWKTIPFFVSSIFLTGCVLSLYVYIAACFGVGMYEKLRTIP